MIGEVARGEDERDRRRRPARELVSRLAGSGAAPQPPTPSVDPLDAMGLDASVRSVLTEYEEHRLRENIKKGLRAPAGARRASTWPTIDKGLAELNGRLKPLAR